MRSASQLVLEKLYDHVTSFIDKYSLDCSETVYQSDEVVMYSDEFVDGCCEIVGYFGGGEELKMITRQEYNQLKEDSRIYHALRLAGVDNWDGWDYAMDILDDEEEE
jgi:hypothetical protein